MRAGIYAYNVLPAFGDCMDRERPFTIKVVEQKTKTAMTQHNVIVRVEQGGFSVDQNEVVIDAGDASPFAGLERHGHIVDTPSVVELAVGTREKLERLPGMQSVSYSLITPLAGGGISQDISINGRPVTVRRWHR